MEDLKEKGNKFFKSQDYDKACEFYLDCILEIEETIENNQFHRKNEELKALEISTRLNYCLCKMKLG